MLIVGELGRAEHMLVRRRAELEQLSASIEHRRAELDRAKARLESATAAANPDAIVSGRSCVLIIEKELTKLRRSREHCAGRVEVLNGYLAGLRERLERLRVEAASLAAGGEQVRLAKVLVQMEAITGGR